jgi:hypothetical protein
MTNLHGFYTRNSKRNNVAEAAPAAPEVASSFGIILKQDA